jgi:tetratricopeptide (TPR) repeat protein
MIRTAIALGLLAVFAGLPSGAWAQRKAATPKDQLQFGIEMAQQSLWSEALFRFKQAERLTDGESAAICNNMAVALEALGQFDQALEYYRKALRLDPENRGLKRNYARFSEFYQSYKPAGEEAPDADATPPSAPPNQTGATGALEP